MAKKRMTADDLDFVQEHEQGLDKQVPQSRVYNQLFNMPGECSTKLADINIRDIQDFPNHPFKVLMNNEMIELRDSIKQSGVLVPVIVRDNGNGKYTMLSGHRRKKAATLAGLTGLPSIIKSGITDDEATIIMYECNRQRANVLPSEKAKSLKMYYDALKRTAGRKSKEELIVPPGGTNLRTCDIVAQQENMGKTQVMRYIRLTHLIPELLDLVDNSVNKDKSMPEMAIKPAVEISYLQPDEQLYFYETVKALNKTPSVQQARMIKELSAKNDLSQTQVMKILIQDKPNQKETVKVDSVRLGSYFDESYTPKEMEAKVFERLESYSKISSIIDKYTAKSPTHLTENDKANLIDNAIKYFITNTKDKTR